MTEFEAVLGTILVVVLIVALAGLRVLVKKTTVMSEQWRGGKRGI